MSATHPETFEAQQSANAWGESLRRCDTNLLKSSEEILDHRGSRSLICRRDPRRHIVTILILSTGLSVQ